MNEPVFCQRINAEPASAHDWTLSLTADERRHVRFRREVSAGVWVTVALPRGTQLRAGDVLSTEGGSQRLGILTAHERVLHVTATCRQDLLKAAYHLGNRHVALEVGPDYLRLLPDAVLTGMFDHLGVQWLETLGPFAPELGAYAGGTHGHAHPH